MATRPLFSMYCVIVRISIDNNCHDKTRDQIIGFNDLGDISLKGAKVRATTRLKKHGYSSFISYGGNRGTIFPWYTSAGHPIWVLRGKKYRYFKHEATGVEIHAYLIPKTHPDAKDQQGLPELMEASTSEIVFQK